MATVRGKNARKRVKVPQVPTAPSDDMLPSQDMLIQKKMINSLPNEMLRYVFVKLEIEKLIGIRGVCTRWQGLAEDICREKRSILIVSKAKNIPDPDLSRTFNGLLDFSKNWTILKVKPTEKRRNLIALSADFCIVLGKLFPQVENLVLNVPLKPTIDTADNLFTLLDNWSSTLVTLGFYVPKYSNSTKVNFIVKTRYAELFNHLNNLSNLKRFAFGDPLEPKYKLDFLNRLEHCTLSIDLDDDMGLCLLDTIPLLGTNCTSLRVFGFMYLHPITQFLKLNAPLVKGLTRLTLNPVHPAVLPFICANFSALQMLDVNRSSFNADNISDLARLSKLTQLSFQYDMLDLPTLARSDLSILSSVQILAITQFYGGQQFDTDQFCRFLSFVFPNVQQLTIRHPRKRVRDKIAQHLNHFVHLRKHVIAPLYPSN